VRRDPGLEAGIVVSAADLEGSLRRRARGHAQHVHPPGPHLHDEQHIQALEEDRADMHPIQMIGTDVSG
jgi:hypothetical protein